MTPEPRFNYLLAQEPLNLFGPGLCIGANRGHIDFTANRLPFKMMS